MLFELYKRWFFIFLLGISVNFLYAFQISEQSQKQSILPDEEVKSWQRIDQLLAEVKRIYKESPSQAIELSEQALALAEESGDVYRQARALISLGRNNKFIGKYDVCLDHFLNALELCQKTKNDTLMVDIYRHIGELYSLWGDLEQSVKYGKLALETVLNQGDSLGMTKCLLELGIIHSNLEENEQALNYLLQAMDIVKKGTYDEIVVAQIYHETGLIYSRMGQLDKALELSNRALAVARKQKHYIAQAFVLKDLAEMYLKSGDERKALRFYEMSIDVQDDLNPLVAVSAYENLANLYEKNGDLINALTYMKLYHALMDSVFNQKMNARITELRIRHAAVTNKLALGRERLMRNISLIGSVYLIFFLIVILHYHRYSQKLAKSLQAQQAKTHEQERRKINEYYERLKAELQYKNRELVTKTVAIAQKRDLLMKLAEDLREIDVSDLTKVTTRLAKLIHGIEREIDIMDWWVEFEKWFSQVHSDFMPNLENKFPDLTLQEKKICAFIRLNLRSKEIAEIMHLQVKSVETYRQSMRKKMRLKSRDNLYQIIAKI